MKKLRELKVREKKRIFEIVKKLREKQLTYNEILKRIRKKFNVNISKSTLIRWCKNLNKPAGWSEINLIPSPQLSYFLGALIGDGNVRRIIHDYKYEIRLKVQNYSFAKNFAKATSHILNKKVKIKKERDFTRSGERYVVSVCNKRLWEFLTDQPLKNLIKIAEKFPKEFLQGLFDAEGFVCNSYIGLANTNTFLLNEVKKLLSIWGIKYKLKLVIKKGQKVKIRGKFYKANKNVYSLLITRKEDVEKFAKFVGFCMKRKKIKLKNLTRRSVKKG